MSADEQVQERVQAGGFWTWYGVLVGIVAWMIHITLVASIVEFTCTAGDAWLWASHLATVVTGAATAYGMWLCMKMIRGAGAPETAGDLAGSTSFLGMFGLITGALSLALILLEGSYVLFIDPCA
ncbi:MAG TPA: hypothetical protein VHE80_01560 [Acidimicrobiales bacterium]|nr:hypothetical protein [Acidimicrobiales bacterium]